MVNSAEIYGYKKGGLREYVEGKLTNGEKDFFKDFRGGFSGVTYNKISRECVAFTDHFGSRPLFVYADKERVLIASAALEIAKYLKRNGRAPAVDKTAAYQVLTYAYVLEDYTLFEGIKKIPPGCFLQIKDGIIRQTRYYAISNREERVSEKDAIEEMERLFLRAVSLQAEKNREYGFHHYAALSAGLDARMVCFTLKKLGIEDVTAFTYSQSGELDEKLPKKMASDLGYAWLYKSLDNGLDLFDIDESALLGDGRQYYLWPSQLNGFLKLIDREKLGVVHTGVIGDVVAGTFYRQMTDKQYGYGDGAYSLTLIDKLKEMWQPPDCDYEIGMLYNRGINGAATGYATSFLTCCEPMSPFMELDFFNFCLSLPRKYRIGHRLYYQWALSKRPEAAKYPHNGLKIKRSHIFVNYQDRPIPLNGIADRFVSNAMSRLGIRKGMNPTEYWHSTNQRLRDYWNAYFQENVGFIRDEELRKDVERLFSTGTTLEKAMCLTLAGTLKNIAESE